METLLGTQGNSAVSATPVCTNNRWLNVDLHDQSSFLFYAYTLFQSRPISSISSFSYYEESLLQCFCFNCVNKCETLC